MTNISHAYKDENGVSTIISVSENDGVTVVRNSINPTTHQLRVSDGTTGSDNGNNNGNAMKDENDVPVWIAVSSTDGKTPIEVYSDPLTQRLLINSQ